MSHLKLLCSFFYDMSIRVDIHTTACLLRNLLRKPPYLLIMLKSYNANNNVVSSYKVVDTDFSKCSHIFLQIEYFSIAQRNNNGGLNFISIFYFLKLNIVGIINKNVRRQYVEKTFNKSENGNNYS